MRIDSPPLDARFEVDEPEPASNPRPPLGPFTLPDMVFHGRQLDVTPQDQGQTNSCGTTSLATVFAYWGNPIPREKIDEAIRGLNSFTAPDEIVRFAQANGMRATLKTPATLETLAGLIDRGVPPIILIDPTGPTDLGLHYVTVVGYQRNKAGAITDLRVADSASNRISTTRAPRLESQWRQLKLAGANTGLDRLVIAIVPNDNRTIVGGDGVARNANSIRLPVTESPAAVQESVPGRLAATVATRVMTGIDALIDLLRSLFGQ